MPVTLIITVYKDYVSLERVLESVCTQDVVPHQVIIAHDTIDQEINPLLERFSSRLPIDHINQQDTGFNKNRILNKAVLASKNEKLVFIDGDCVLHHKFISAHQTCIQKGIFTAGRRLDLDEKTSTLVREKGNFMIQRLRMLKNGTKRIEEGFYFRLINSPKKPRLLGCNMGWHRQDLEALNGFDMDYTLPGFGEDTDLEYRAYRSGMRSKNLRWKAIQYHLHHERPSREQEISQSKQLFEEKKEIGYFYCENGLSTLISKFPHE